MRNSSIIGKISFNERYNSEEKRLLYEIKQKSLNKSKIVKNVSLIKYHSYKTIDSRTKLQDLKNIVTYILFPRNLIRQNKKSKKYKRYTQVLELIQEFKKVKSSNSSTSTTTTTTTKEYENKFILPKIKSLNGDKVTVETYNYELSNEILDFFKERITPLFFDKDGPFFITVTKNVFNQEKISSFIYLDLSTFNESAINQVINSYKHRLVEKGNDDIGTLEESHYAILSAITNFNDNLHLFQVALAGEE